MKVNFDFWFKKIMKEEVEKQALACLDISILNWLFTKCQKALQGSLPCKKETIQKNSEILLDLIQEVE